MQFPNGKYSIILADPPWEFKTYSAKGQKKSASQHYPTMTADEIKAVPVASLADPKGCLLILWVTGAQAAAGLHCEIMTAWGFKPSGFGAWGKITRNGLPAFGTGYVLRDAVEPFFTGKRGRVPAALKHTERNLILAERREHSRKPDQMYDVVERLVPDTRRIELFARRLRPGWDAWGNQANKYSLFDDAGRAVGGYRGIQPHIIVGDLAPAAMAPVQAKIRRILARRNN